MKRNLPTITPILYTSKTLANGEHPIMLRVCYNGKRTYKSIGISCKPSEWSKDKNKVKGSRASSLNTIITREMTKANDYVLSLEGKDDYTATTIIKHLSKSAPTQITLYSSNPQPIGFSGILLAKRQNSFYCTYFLHNRNVADTKSPYPIKRLEVIRWFNQKSMVFNQSLS